MDYRDTGTGTPVLALHGALSDSTVWDPCREALMTACRFVALTLRYHGSQSWPDPGENYDAQTHADDLIAFVELRNLPPVHLVGWSYGGAVALRAMLGRPNLFASAVLFEPSVSGLMSEEGDARLEAAFVEDLNEVLLAGEDLPDRERAMAFVRFVDGRAPEDRSGFDGAVERMIARNARTLRPLLGAIASTRMTLGEMSLISQPVTIVRGSNSLLRYRRLSERVAAELPSGRLIEIAGGRHLAPLTRAAEMALALEWHLAAFKRASRLGAPVVGASGT
ncbi:alpha/beta hydrolase [Nisaea acidiphila]|uniref:Alpha/beta hydrolase n=1 Tax=Nisaea acidiphila TaxID=1862145 RepID=A0A9J7AU41_9PROT|nr:alpha/beta hydrolase [Nisaea acidiphila]UUX50872.1 alpha/beta hydrolase [Nisaea acidiphila]